MNNQRQEEQVFAKLAQKAEYPEEAPAAASARLKSKIYSSLVKRQQETGPLLSITETKGAGGELCVFEDMWAVLPVGEDMKCRNLCSICHARVLAENLEKPPIYWPGCPYVAFHKG